MVTDSGKSICDPQKASWNGHHDPQYLDATTTLNNNKSNLRNFKIIFAILYHRQFKQTKFMTGKLHSLLGIQRWSVIMQHRNRQLRSHCFKVVDLLNLTS